MISSSFEHLLKPSAMQRPAMFKGSHFFLSAHELHLLEQLRVEPLSGEGGRRYE